MADYTPPPSPIAPLEQLRREILAADPTAIVQIVYGQVVSVSAPKLDVPTLKGILGKYPEVVPPSALPTAVVLTPISGSALI